MTDEPIKPNVPEDAPVDWSWLKRTPKRAKYNRDSWRSHREQVAEIHEDDQSNESTSQSQDQED